MPPDVAGEVMDHLKWDRRASAVFRKICKGWRDSHDERVTCLNGLEGFSGLVECGGPDLKLETQVTISVYIERNNN